MNNFIEFLELVSRVFPPSEKIQDKSIFMLNQKGGFESFGKATENFDYVYNLVLPLVPYHWKSKDGWKRGEDWAIMSLKGDSIESVAKQAIEFLNYYKKVLDKQK